MPVPSPPEGDREPSSSGSSFDAMEQALQQLADRQTAELQRLSADLVARMAGDTPPASAPEERGAPSEPVAAVAVGEGATAAGARRSRRPSRWLLAAGLIVIGTVAAIGLSLYRQPAGGAGPATASAPTETAAAGILPSSTASVSSASSPASPGASSMVTAVAPVGTVTSTTPAPPLQAAARTPSPNAATPTPVDPGAQLQATLAALKTGQLQAVVDYGNGSKATADLSFDFGDAGNPPRLHSTTVYSSAAGSQTQELIAIGTQEWTRAGTGGWTAQAEQEGVWARVQPYLPHPPVGGAPERTADGTGQTLHWSGADADLTVQFDPGGTPHQYRQVNHATGSVLVVTYLSWNNPVAISPPPAG